MKLLIAILFIWAVASGMPAEQQEQKDDASRAICPLVMCDTYCPSGHAIDSKGCTLCACNNFLSLKPICPLVMCALYCENGFQIGDNGCQTCKCNTGITAVDETNL
ncbi:unnamed protein product [Candidula unifasciata]|uniref:Antistasin-like domain-containing protein n=1 Tax=Candidula unifasciata TaxID=100452 RepID=A0A8S3ZBQ8_9EUPU|nr:unnamed protein product [Candidula unifasciata]